MNLFWLSDSLRSGGYRLRIFDFRGGLGRLLREILSRGVSLSEETSSFGDFGFKEPHLYEGFCIKASIFN